MGVTREQLERAITYVAGVMVRLDLPQLAPILDRLQAEFEKFDREDPIGRARDNLPPRGMTRTQAAAYCACTPRGFDSWVSRGIVPGAMPGTKRWDRKAIDAALDKLSELAPPCSYDPESPEAAFDEWQNKNARAA